MSRLPVHACVFDAYGTLLDLTTAVAPQAAVLGEAAAPLLALWRRKQLEYTWLRTLMGRHAGFETVTREALAYALASLGLASTDLETSLLRAFRGLGAFPEAAAALAALRRAGIRTAVLSNGDPDMLADALGGSGLAPLLDHVISVQAVGAYKPAPGVYALASRVLGVDPGAIVFVSGNPWDACGAASAGLRAVCIDAVGLPPEGLPARPETTIRSLSDLPGLLA